MYHRTASLSAALALVLIAAQVGTIYFAPSSLAVRLVLPATVALVPAALWPHRHNAGVWVMYVGLAANLTAMLSNGGLMPIERSTMESAIGVERASQYATGEWVRGSKDVLLEPGSGRLTELGDAIIIRAGGNGLVASAGDLVVVAGIVVLCAEVSWRWQRRRGTTSHAIQKSPAAPAQADGAEGGAVTLT